MSLFAGDQAHTCITFDISKGMGTWIDVLVLSLKHQHVHLPRLTRQRRRTPIEHLQYDSHCPTWQHDGWVTNPCPWFIAFGTRSSAVGWKFGCTVIGNHGGLLGGTEDLVEEIIMLLKRMSMQDTGANMIYATDGNSGCIHWWVWLQAIINLFGVDRGGVAVDQWAAIRNWVPWLPKNNTGYGQPYDIISQPLSLQLVCTVLHVRPFLEWIDSRNLQAVNTVDRSIAIVYFLRTTFLTTLTNNHSATNNKNWEYLDVKTNSKLHVCEVSIIYQPYGTAVFLQENNPAPTSIIAYPPGANVRLQSWIFSRDRLSNLHSKLSGPMAWLMDAHTRPWPWPIPSPWPNIGKRPSW